MLGPCVYAQFLFESVTFLAFMPLLLMLCLFDFAVRSRGCLTYAAWKTYGLLGSCSLPFISSLDWALLGWRPSPSCLAHVLFFLVSVGLLVGDHAIPLYCSCYIITSLLFLVTRGLTGWYSCRASPFFTSLPLLGFIG